MLLVRGMQIDAIQSADGERHDDLDEAEDGVDDVGEGHLGAMEDAHLASLSIRCFVDIVSYRNLLVLMFVWRVMRGCSLIIGVDVDVDVDEAREEVVKSPPCIPRAFLNNHETSPHHPLPSLELPQASTPNQGTPRLIA